MRLILEKEDLLQVLEKHFTETFDREKVQVRADPFEVELMGLPLPAPENEPTPSKKTGSSKPPQEPVPRRGEEASLVARGWEVTDPRPVHEPTVDERPLGRNASFEAPPVSADETNDNPATIVQASVHLTAELEQQRNAAKE